MITWSKGSPRILAACIAMLRLSLTWAWPMKSASLLGRSDRSRFSSSGCAAPEITLSLPSDRLLEFLTLMDFPALWLGSVDRLPSDCLWPKFPKGQSLPHHSRRGLGTASRKPCHQGEPFLFGGRGTACRAPTTLTPGPLPFLHDRFSAGREIPLNPP